MRFEPPPPIVGSIDSEYIQGVVKLDDRLGGRRRIELPLDEITFENSF